MHLDTTEARLRTWLSSQLPGADDIRVSGLDSIDTGHSAETLLVSIDWRADGATHREDVVVRVQPPSPALLEPYDLPRQFEILQALESTSVRSPRARWLEPTGDVLGQPYYVMDRLPGIVYERVTAEEMDVDDAGMRRMCESVVEQIAAIHTVDLEAVGLATIDDGRAYLDRELDRWSAEIQRTQRGPLPALERLGQALREHQPAPCPTVTLVHGDPKVGNFAFVGTEVSAVFDWEMATVGDPLADLGWVEVLWPSPGLFTSHPAAPSIDEVFAQWEALTGIEAQHRPWYRAFQSYKMAAISLVASHLFDIGHTDDLRMSDMAYSVRPLTQVALADLGIEEELETGPVLARKERRLEVQARAHG